MRRTLEQSLEQSVEASPRSIALRFGDRSITYCELWDSASRLGALLIANGVRRGDRVGICLRKCPEAVAAIFGTLLAGGVYVPIDPSAPPARRNYIAANCGMRVVFTDQKLHGSFTGELKALAVDEPAVWTSDSSGLARVPLVDADLASILYTSGSTGDPKGVMLSHRNILNFVEWSREEFDVSPSDRLTSHAPLHFDLSTFDLFAGLGAGATVVLVPEAVAALAAEMLDLLARERITITYMVPFSLTMLVTLGDPSRYDLSNLRCVLFAGETFPLPHLRRLAATLPHSRFCNLYGPTETNVCTWYEVQREDLAEGRESPIPIGSACPNVDVFALDDNGRPVTEPGVTGELWVRGGGVALGYWADETLSQSRFKANPQIAAYCDPSYQTGDLATLSANKKDWIFLGRRDQMVKLRGYRIELGDVEACLYRNPEVRDAVAIAPRDEFTGVRLIAFVAPARGRSPQEHELLAWCRRQLQRYMVPDRILVRDELPRTSSGKFDRKLLESEHRGGK